MKVGFIGLGNVGGKLAGSLMRNGIDLTVRDLDKTVAQPFLDQGASWADSPAELAASSDVVIPACRHRPPLQPYWKGRMACSRVWRLVKYGSKCPPLMKPK